MSNNPATGTRLGKLVADAGDVLVELRRLEGSRKLSPDGFLRAALANADIDEGRCRALAQKITDDPVLVAAHRYIRQLVRQFREPSWPHPPPREKIDKLVRIYGTPQAASQLSAINCSEAEAVAVGAMLATQQHPEAFGEIATWDEYEKKVAKLHAKLDAAYSAIASAVSLADLVIEHDSLSPSERAVGLCKIRFKRWPEISPVEPDWQRRLVETALAADAGQRAA